MPGTPVMPSASYRYLRGGAGARIGSTLSLSARAGYRHVLSSGELTAEPFFPGASIRGVDASVVVAYAIGGGFEAQLGGVFAGYFLGATPDGVGLTDDSGFDRYLSGFIAAGYGF